MRLPMLSERAWPWTVGSIGPVAGTIVIGACGARLDRESVASLLEGVAQLGGVLVGFTSTAQGLIFALPDRQSIKFVKAAGGIARLARYLFDDIVVWLAATVLAISLRVALPEQISPALGILLIVWSYLPVTGVLTTWRSANYTSKLLRLASQPQPNDADL